MLTCLNWVPPGKAKPLADNYNFEKGGDDNEDVQMDEEEEEDNEQMNEESSAAVSKAREVAAAITGADDIVKLYNLDSYDDEEGMCYLPVHSSAPIVTLPYHDSYSCIGT